VNAQLEKKEVEKEVENSEKEVVMDGQEYSFMEKEGDKWDRMIQEYEQAKIEKLKKETVDVKSNLDREEEKV